MSNPFDMMHRQQEQMRKQQQEMQRKQQEQMRKQQEQMRKMQEDTRRRQQMGAWAEKQRQEQAVVAPAADRFAEVERQAAALRHERAAGRLTEEDLKARLSELMIQDEAGAWWMVGTRSGEWYRSQGDKWVRAALTKPTSLRFGAASAVPTAAPQRHRLKALIALPVGIALTLAIAYTAAGFAGTIVGPAGQWGLAWLLFFVLLIGGLIITVRQVGKLWSGG